MTLQQLQQRHSVRSYTDTPLTESQVNAIKAVITDINTHEAGMHFQLFTNDPTPFAGFTRSYGMFKGVRNYVAAVVDHNYSFVEEKAGYNGQRIAMKATLLGLGSCIISGTYSRKNVNAQLRAGQEILFLIALGEAQEEQTSMIAKLTRKVAKRSSKAPEDFYTGQTPINEAFEKHPLLAIALKAVACAPSAMNKQPVQIALAQGPDGTERIEASTTGKEIAQQIDLGIALYNFEQLWPGYWEWGNPAIFMPD